VSRVALLDVNVLVALFDPDHVHHELAHDWFGDHRPSGWATCPVTENGFIRVLANPAYASSVTRASDLAARLRRFCESAGHVFWPDTVSLREATRFDTAAVAGYRQLTDVYLLGLARSHGGRLATFDRTIPISPVLGAKAADLLVIGPAQ